uniref:Uncharacterized protein n=1 Tax=Plectus sambesii TaxID=2011161 RepID=A0A914VVT7_9BILA
MEKLTERFENLDIEFQPVAVAYHDTNALWVADADCLKIGRAGCIEYDDWLVDDNAPEVVWFSVRLFKKNLPTISQYPKEQKEKPPKARIILSIMDHPQLQLLHTDKFLMYPVHHVPMNYKVDGKDVNTLQAHYLFIRADHKFGDFLNTKPKRSGERIEKCSIDSKNEYLWFNTDQKKWMYKNKDAEERDVWVNIGIAEEILDEVAAEGQIWGLRINKKKTKVMKVSRTPSETTIKLGNEKLEQFDRNYKNHFSGHVLYCTGDDNKTTAGTGFYILASLAFIRLYTLNYTDNDDSTNDGTGNDGTGNDDTGNNGTTGNDDFHQTTHVRVNG